ncbi:MAG TPA: sulfurtransferase [Terriglobales bacterium]|nr:sulfurtransferase [Terriglobales bacterium]
MRKFQAVAVIAVLLISVRISAQPGAAHPEMLVSSEWLAQHLKDPNLVILHVADKKSDFNRGHIPGARYLSTDDFVAGDAAELPSPQQLQEVFQKLGVSNNSRIVIYTTAWWPMAARAYYTLDYFGLGERTSLLDGGIEHWTAQKRPVSQESSPATSGKLTPHIHEEVRAVLADAKKASATDSTDELLVDARPERRYTAGHLPGAARVYWQETLLDAKDDPVLLSPDQLKALFASRGIKPGETLITYCEVGLQASHMYFVAKYLGYNAAMYDGSFHEWSMMNGLPLVKGDSPR